MGFLKRFFRSHAAVQQLPAGTITVDRNGQILSSTVPSNYSRGLLRDIGRDVLEMFLAARTAELPLAEVNLQFGSLHISARELRGGAIIFLLPQSALTTTPKPARS
jgi:hypothetical protein